MLGWASQPGAGYQGTSIATTTGGGNATPVTFTTLAALNSAAGGTSAAVIYVKGVLAAGTVKVGSNKTIAGICGAELHGHVDMSGSVNVIFRNLKVVGYNCSDSLSECESGADASTSGSKTSGGTGFTPPYGLTPDATGNLEATIRAQAGPR